MKVKIMFLKYCVLLFFPVYLYSAAAAPVASASLSNVGQVALPDIDQVAVSKSTIFSKCFSQSMLTDLIATTKTVEPSGLYTCPICNNSFQNSVFHRAKIAFLKHLGRELNRKKAGITTFRPKFCCEFCPISFSQHACLASHTKLHHKTP